MHGNKYTHTDLRSVFLFFVFGKVYLRSQILDRPSINEYWHISGVPVLPENVILTFFRMCRCYPEAHNTGIQNGPILSKTRVPAVSGTFSEFVKTNVLFAAIIRHTDGENETFNFLLIYKAGSGKTTLKGHWTSMTSIFLYLIL